MADEPAVEATAPAAETGAEVKTMIPTEETVSFSSKKTSDAAAPTSEVADTKAETAPAAVTFTKEQVDQLLKEELSKLEAKWTPKLQDGAHNAKLAEAIQKLSERLQTDKAVESESLPEGFEVLPEPVQKRLIGMDTNLKALQMEHARIAEERVQLNINQVAASMEVDKEYGELFKKTVPAIIQDMANPTIKMWVRQDPKNALETLFKKHAFSEIQTLTKQAASAKVAQAARVATKPSTVSPTVETVSGKPAKMGFDEGFEKAVAELGWDGHSPIKFSNKG